MNFSELKKLMGENGRLVIVENDKAAYVVLTAREFLALPASVKFSAGSETRREWQGNEPENKITKSVSKPELTAGKKSPTSFANFEDTGEALGLQDITFEDLGIDELPE